MLKMALMVLTLTEAGATRVTLSTTEDADDCAGLKNVITSILDESKVTTLAAICAPSALELTPFDHKSRPEDEVHRYRVEVWEDGKYLVAPLALNDACVADQAGQPAVYCARSSQQVLGQ